jgi:serine/threonine protein phosphatase 1
MVLRRLFRKERAAPAARYAIPDGRRVYAIGDIHGRDDLFAEMLDLIERDEASAGQADTTLILLGDLVDRGPESKQVIDRAIALSRRWADVRLLLGNHEEVFLKALGGDPQLVRYFLQIGGAPTINSYGLSGDAYYCLSFAELAERLPALIPAEHQAFLAGGVDRIRVGDYLFVHAGIRPGVPEDGQKPSDLRWIRQDFLSDRRDHGLMVVHGHTISEKIEEMPNRIGVDTGAYRSGILSAVVLEGSGRRYLQTGGGGR